MFVNWDLEMYHEPTDTAANCRTMELVQELGQVDYVFSDKTGTLTRNEMKLVGCIASVTSHLTGSQHSLTATHPMGMHRWLVAPSAYPRGMTCQCDVTLTTRSQPHIQCNVTHSLDIM